MKSLKYKILYIVIAISILHCNRVFANINVFACEAEWAALVKEITGSDDYIYVAVDSAQDAHDVNPKPSMIKKAAQADLLVCNGAGLEISWLDKVITASNNPKIQYGEIGYFIAGDNLQLQNTSNHENKYTHIIGNPHFHLNPNNILKIARNLLLRIIEIDPKNSAIYQKNYQRFSKKFAKEIKKWQKELKHINQVNIITIHNRYKYLEQWLGLKNLGIIEANSHSGVSIKHLKKIQNIIDNNNIKFALISNFDDKNYIEWLKNNSDVNLIMLPYAPSSLDLFALYQEISDLLSELHN